MALRLLDQATGLVHQVTGPEEHPPLVYLPGVHGDWTPLGRARSLLNESFQLVEAAYPRVAHWSLADFSQALESLLDALKLDSVHLVGESFGSLVAWEFGLTHPRRVRSLALVGGFSHPPSRTAGLAKHALSLVPTALFETGVDMYVAHKNRRGEPRHPPGEGVPPYAAVRTASGRRATANRMRLIQRTDFRPLLSQVAFPVRYIGGEKDRLVPVQRELRTLQQHLPAICNFQGRVLPGAPHMIIVSHPEQTVEHLAEWVSQAERNREGGKGQPAAGQGRILLE
jgi:3-oxoadipate enol-lactonase